MFVIIVVYWLANTDISRLYLFVTISLHIIIDVRGQNDLLYSAECALTGKIMCVRTRAAKNNDYLIDQSFKILD